MANVTFYRCSIAYETTTTIKCNGTLESVINPSQDSTGYYISCSQHFVKSYNLLKCNDTITSGTFDQLPTDAQLWQASNFTHTAQGKIKDVVDLTNIQVQTVQQIGGSTNNPEDYVLNLNYMKVVLTGSFTFFAFGLLLGAIIGMMRKAAQR